MELIRQCHAERIPAVPLAEHGQTPERRLGARFAPPISIGARKESPSAVSRLKAGAPGGRHAWTGPLVILALSRWMVSAVLAGGSGLPTAVQAPGESNATPSAVEQFKRFISSPPVIKNLVFQQKVPMDGGARPLDGSFAFSTRFEYFQAKWQTNGYLFRQLGSPLDATNFTVFGELASWSGHRHALVESGVHLTTWDDRDPSVWGQNRSVFYTSRFMLHPLREVMNLGIMYSGIGGVRWMGNRVHTKQEAEHERLFITVQSVPPQNGPARSLKVRHMFPHRKVLSYTRNCGLVKHGACSVPDMTGHLATCLAETFESTPFMHGDHRLSRVYTNGVIYELGNNGTLHLIDGLRSGPLAPLHNARGVRTISYGCWASVNLTIFTLMVGVNEENGKQRQNK